MRKSFPKILIAFFLTVFVVQIICLFFLLAAPVASQAAQGKFAPQVPIPGIEKEFGPPIDGGYTIPGSTASIAKYVKVIYNYAIGIIGILAAVVLMIGGVLWIVAGGNTTQIGEAKAWIGASLTGLILALTSYLILNTVNPALVNLQTTGVPGVAEIKTGSCTKIGASGAIACVDGYTKEECNKLGGVFVEKAPCYKSCCDYVPDGPGGTSDPNAVRTCVAGVASDAECQNKSHYYIKTYHAEGTCKINTSNNEKYCEKNIK